MRPYNCNNLSALVNLVHGKHNDPDGETAASAECATTSPFLVPVGSMCVSVSLYTVCNHVAVFELTGSFSLTLMVNRNVFARISGNGEQGGGVF